MGVQGALAADAAFHSEVHALAGTRGPGERDRRLAELRRRAVAEQRGAAVELTEGLRLALAREGCATPLATWLEVIAEAGAARAAAAAAPAYFAFVGARLHG